VNPPLFDGFVVEEGHRLPWMVDQTFSFPYMSRAIQPFFKKGLAVVAFPFFSPLDTKMPRNCASFFLCGASAWSLSLLFFQFLFSKAFSLFLLFF